MSRESVGTNLSHRVGWDRCNTYLQVLCHVQDSRDVQGALLVEVAEGIREISRFDLPYPHENELMVRVSSEEHS